MGVHYMVRRCSRKQHGKNEKKKDQEEIEALKKVYMGGAQEVL